MKPSASDLQTLSTRAARGAGFTPAHAARFGRAAVHHMADGRDHAALLDALRDPGNSPILRLPLLLEDLLKACTALSGTAELTLLGSDVALAPSYARLLPVHLSECEVVKRGAQRRLRISTDGKPQPTTVLPEPGEVPQPLIDRLKRLAVHDTDNWAEPVQRRGA